MEDSRILDSICSKEEAEYEEDSWIWEGFVGGELAGGTCKFYGLILELATFNHNKLTFYSVHLEPK